MSQADPAERTPSHPYEAPLAETVRSVEEDWARMPPGIPYIIGNEAAERFSYYGMRSILIIFMTKYLMGSDGQAAYMTDEEAKFWYHTFVSSVYFFPIFGALISDGLLGKYRTILSVSIIYCLGHLALALDETRVGLAVGLTLIAIGSGGIKPCVSANVGDQFTDKNRNLLPKAFAWFYFAINFGSAIATFAIPAILDWTGSTRIAFGLPGILMLIATIVFWAGSKRMVKVPPAGLGFVQDAISPVGLRTLGRLAVIYFFVAIFWSLYDQGGAAWVLQAQAMDRRLIPFDYVIPAGSVQGINPVLILIYIPLFSYVIYPAINRVFPLTALRKMSIGFFLTACSFLVSVAIERMIAAGTTPHVYWQWLAYVILTAAEVMVSVTSLEFAYTQAPPTMKSVVMALSLLSVSLGNAFAAGVNLVIKNDDGTSKLAGESYYWFFLFVMLVASVIFIFVARWYREGAPQVDAST